MAIYILFNFFSFHRIKAAVQLDDKFSDIFDLCVGFVSLFNGLRAFVDNFYLFICCFFLFKFCHIRVLPASAGPPSGGRTATLTPLSPMYSTRPWCLVQAITRHLYPDPYLKLLGSLDPHCTSWVNEQQRPAGFEPRLVPDFPPPQIPTIIINLVSGPVWWEAGTNIMRVRTHTIPSPHLPPTNVKAILAEEQQWYFLTHSWENKGVQ